MQAELLESTTQMGKLKASMAGISKESFKEMEKKVAESEAKYAILLAEKQQMVRLALAMNGALTWFLSFNTGRRANRVGKNTQRHKVGPSKKQNESVARLGLHSIAVYPFHQAF